ncbi:MAG: RluA family pseudouridine synthase [Lachnospirales bacterium]
MNKIFEDKNLLIVAKDNKLSVQRDKKGNDGLLEILQKEYKELYLINRIDTNVSGLVIFAKTKECSSKLSDMLNKKTIKKVYYAIVEGDVKNSDTLVHWLFKNQRLNISKVVNKNSQSAKESILSYGKVATFEYENKVYSYVKIKLETGRHHQIRVQFSHIGHPLYGDKKYNASFKGVGENIALCGKELHFTHPITRERLHLSCDFPEEDIWQKAISYNS